MMRPLTSATVQYRFSYHGCAAQRNFSTINSSLCIKLLIFTNQTAKVKHQTDKSPGEFQTMNKQPTYENLTCEIKRQKN